MLDMRTCPECNGERLKKECLNVFISVKKNKSDFDKYSIANLQKIPLKELVEILLTYKDKTEKDKTLVQRITHPLIDRCQTIGELGLGYLMLSR
jgi:excinuclease UvrABC ATPase subunit